MLFKPLTFRPLLSWLFPIAGTAYGLLCGAPLPLSLVLAGFGATWLGLMYEVRGAIGALVLLVCTMIYLFGIVDYQDKSLLTSIWLCYLIGMVTTQLTQKKSRSPAYQLETALIASTLETQESQLEANPLEETLLEKEVEIEQLETLVEDLLGELKSRSVPNFASLTKK